MKTRRLHRVLALATLDFLGHHSLSLANMKRYVTFDLLSSYCIRRNTTIKDRDRKHSLAIAINAVKAKPYFRILASDSPKTEERKEFILSGMADPESLE